MRFLDQEMMLRAALERRQLEDEMGVTGPAEQAVVADGYHVEFPKTVGSLALNGELPTDEGPIFL